MIAVSSLQIAFSSISLALQFYVKEFETKEFRIHHGVIEKREGSSPNDPNSFFLRDHMALKISWAFTRAYVSNVGFIESGTLWIADQRHDIRSVCATCRCFDIDIATQNTEQAVLKTIFVKRLQLYWWSQEMLERRRGRKLWTGKKDRIERTLH